MKVNPFEFQVEGNALTWTGDDEKLFIESFPVEIPEIPERRFTASRDRQDCLQVILDGKKCKKHVVYWKGRKTGPDKDAGGGLDGRGQASARALLSPFMGITEFRMKHARNTAFLHDPVTKTHLLGLGLYRLNWHNFQREAGAWELVEDLAFKMGVNVHLFLFVESTTSDARVGGCLLVLEPDRTRFSRIMTKIGRMKGFNFIADASVRASPKVLARVLLRRLPARWPVVSTKKTALVKVLDRLLGKDKKGNNVTSCAPVSIDLGKRVP